MEPTDQEVDNFLKSMWKDVKFSQLMDNFRKELAAVQNLNNPIVATKLRALAKEILTLDMQ